MSVIWAVFYGIIQGLTEFLPISSSGHLAILQGIFSTPSQVSDYFAFDVLLHLATLFSVCIMYRRELISVVPAFFGVIKKIFCGRFKFVECNPEERLAIFVFIATLPLVPAIAVEDWHCVFPCKYAFCGFSSFGRARPCQGRGGGFEPRNPLHLKTTKIKSDFCRFLLNSIWRHSQVVRQRSAKPLFPSSNLGGASKTKSTSQEVLFVLERCVPPLRNEMCTSCVMFPPEVMCASRVRMRNTSHHFATKEQNITVP